MTNTIQVGKPLPKDFSPDIQFTVKVDTKSGAMMIQSANGQPINPLVLTSICANVVKVNIDQILSVQNQLVINKGRLPHQFLALEGEHRCRVPGCGKIHNDLIHIAVIDEPDVQHG